MCHTWSIACVRGSCRTAPHELMCGDAVPVGNALTSCALSKAIFRFQLDLPLVLFPSAHSRSDLRNAMHRPICDDRHIGSGKTRI